MTMRAATGAVAAWMLFLATMPAPARPAHSGPAWVAEKCARYQRAWDQAFARQGAAGIGSAFLAAHRTFLDSGCVDRPPVCPRSAEELKLANTMVILAMNAGTASTFPPFACSR